MQSYDDRNLDIVAFEKIIGINEIRGLAFQIARDRSLHWSELEKLLVLGENREVPVTLFANFDVGGSLKQLPREKALEFVNRIRAIDNTGKATAFFLLNKWAQSNDETWASFEDFLRQMALEDSGDILNEMKSTMDFYDWAEAILRLLKDKKDDQLASMLMRLIIDQSSELEYFYNKEHSFFRILDFLEGNYFDIFWSNVSDLLTSHGERGMALYNLKDLLGSKHDFLQNTVGILFKGGDAHFETILEWAKNQPVNNLHWLANMLPIYNVHPNGADDWHPYARKFIDLFGDQREILSGIHAKLNTYSWSGSIEPKLESDVRLFEKLLDHPKKNVSKWAKAEIEDLKKRIKQESNRNKDGYFGDVVVSGSLG